MQIRHSNPSPQPCNWI